MILTVTFNPLLEKRYFFDEIDLNSANKAKALKLIAGGKGVNVSRQLNYLGANNQAFLFLGGENGKILRRILFSEKINFVSVNIKDNIGEGYVFIDKSKNQKYVFFGLGFKVNDYEVIEFIDKLRKAIANSEIVVFSGSLPQENCQEILYEGLKACLEYDKISILDTYGPLLNEVIKLKPTVLHNNIDEMKKSLNINLDNSDQIIDFLKSVYCLGIKRAFLTDGDKDFFCSNFDFIYKVAPKKIQELDSIGSGDSFTAGLAYGFYKDLTFEETLKLACALGTLNAASYDAREVKFDENNLRNFYPIITPIGKKINTLFDN